VNAIERTSPSNESAVSRELAAANRNGQKLRIVGGNTLRGMGGRPQIDFEIDTTAIDGVVDFEPEDLTVGVLAGTRLDLLAKTLAERGQMLAFDAPSPTQATVGGTLASGWRGPRRHLYGPPRDWAIGSTVVLADGTIARAGGMVVKNVAGYDLSRLYVGSFGTLAVLVRANLKTIPIPHRTRAFHAALPEGARERALAQLHELAIAPSAAFWIDGFSSADEGDAGDDGRLTILLEGTAHAVDRESLNLRSALGRGGVPASRVLDDGANAALQSIVDAYVAALGQRSITYRIGSLPTDAMSTAEAATSVARQFDLRCERIVDLMNGDVVVRVSDLDAQRLAASMHAFDATLHERIPQAVVVACEHPERESLQVWGREPAAIAQMRALKRRFDPNNILNPGRFVGGI
jgi:glycolate oxidase FAD binding subunit